MLIKGSTFAYIIINMMVVVSEEADPCCRSSVALADVMMFGEGSLPKVPTTRYCTVLVRQLISTMPAALTDLVTVVPPDEEEEEEPEDIFAFAAGLIFTDDSRNFHGDDRSLVVYKSARFGDIELRTADPSQEDDRQLFAHYLWNAGIKMAELLSDPPNMRWRVKDERVLELGAGGTYQSVSMMKRKELADCH